MRNRLASIGDVVHCWGQGSKPGRHRDGTRDLGDTQKPARFAQVLLFGVPASVTPMGKSLGDPKDDPGFRQIDEGGDEAHELCAESDGSVESFAMDTVAPGDYYVMASVQGMCSRVNLVKAAFDAGEDGRRVSRVCRSCHVSADRSDRREISVDRGAAIAGIVLWEDGAPVTEGDRDGPCRSGEEKPLPAQSSMVVDESVGAFANTDDLGRFRISAWRPESTREAMLQTNRQLTMQRGRFDPCKLRRGSL